MKILFDTNIILDLLLKRDPFHKDAHTLISKVETGEISGYLCATTITTIHYFVAKQQGKKSAMHTINSLLKLFEVANVTRSVLIDAIEADDYDYEDSVLYKSAYHAGASFIVTRDKKGFGKSDIPALAPEELLDLLKGLHL